MQMPNTLAPQGEVINGLQALEIVEAATSHGHETPQKLEAEAYLNDDQKAAVVMQLVEKGEVASKIALWANRAGFVLGGIVLGLLVFAPDLTISKAAAVPVAAKVAAFAAASGWVKGGLAAWEAISFFGVGTALRRRHHRFVRAEHKFEGYRARHAQSRRPALPRA